MLQSSKYLESQYKDFVSNNKIINPDERRTFSSRMKDYILFYFKKTDSVEKVPFDLEVKY